MNVCKITFFLLMFFGLVFTAQVDHSAITKKINSQVGDSAKVEMIKALIDTIEDNAVWPRYNDWMMRICEKNYYPGKRLGANLGQAYNNKGYILNFLGKTDSALIYYKKAMAIRRDMKDSSGMAAVLVNIGFMFQNRAALDSAQVYYDKGLVLYRQFNNPEGEATVLNNKASIYQLQGRVKDCIASLISAMKIYEKLKDQRGVAWICNSIGYVYEHQDEYDTALEWYNHGLQVAEKENDLTNQALLCNNIATTFDKQRKFQESVKLHMKALGIQKKLNNVRGIIMSLNNIGSVYSSMGNLAPAESHLLECRSLCYEVKSVEALARCYVNLAEVYSRYGKTRQAKMYADSSLLLSQQADYAEMIYNASNKCYELEKKLGNYKSALSFLELNVKMNDSIKSESIRKELYKKQYDYELKQKEELFKEREARKETELKRQRLIRYVFTGGFVIALLLIVIIFKSLREHRRKNKIISRQRDLVYAKQKEIVDSIYYARKIQQALFPSEKYMDRHLNNDNRKDKS